MATTWARFAFEVAAALKVSLPILPNPLIPILTYDISVTLINNYQMNPSKILYFIT
jgi:hypothetical protein